MGSMSVMGFEERKQIFRPLIPDVDFITFNNPKKYDLIVDIQGDEPLIDPRNIDNVIKFHKKNKTFLGVTYRSRFPFYLLFVNS